MNSDVESHQDITQDGMKGDGDGKGASGSGKVSHTLHDIVAANGS